MTNSLPLDYAQRVYAGWIGKCAGVRLGAPLENWTYDQIRATVGEVTDFLPLPPGKLFKPDDDTAFPLILMRALEDYGPDVTAAQMGETVLNYLGDQRGTLWWGGYGVSTEHTAYANLAAGIPAPLSGSLARNGATLAEQIGGQIFSDIWGLVAPNQPALAADYAAKAASVTHDGDGIQGARFIAALVSLAFRERNPATLVAQALKFVTPGSEYARVVQSVVEFWRTQPADWHACYDYLRHHFGYDRYPGMVHIIPNTGIVVMALLYSQGDFSRAVQIATMGGWDTDCNAGNVGAIMGVAVGLSDIEARWRRPMKDLLVAASITGERNLTDLPACADRFVQMGRLLTGTPTAAAEPRPRLHFDYPGATHGARSAARLAAVIDLHEEGGALAIVLRGLKKKGEASVFWRTYCRPAELSANYYGASFSPTIYPGQTITARLYAPADARDLLAALFVRDDNGDVIHQGQATALAEEGWHELTFQIPPQHNALLAQVGIMLHTLGEAWNGRLLLDDLTWHGPADFSSDFQAERAEYGAISQWTYLRGYWRREADGYHGSAAGIGESYTGAHDWRDLNLRVGLKPLVGDYHNVLVRVQGARRAYAVGLAPENRLVIYKNAGGYAEVAAMDFAWRPGERYALAITAHGNVLTVTTEDGRTLRWHDEEAPYLHGQIGLGVMHSSHTCCTDLQVSGLGPVVTPHVETSA